MSPIGDQVLEFHGRVALVTGAGRGIGRAHALRLAERGARVLVNDPGHGLDGSESGEAARPADEVVDEIHRLGGSAAANYADISEEAGADEAVASAVGHFGGVDIVINNAGILKDKTLQKMTVQDFDTVVRVHLRGTYLVSQAAWPYMVTQKSGAIVNTTSVAGLLGNFGQANYAAAKAGIVGLTHVQAIEGAKYGIRANVIEPAARTRMTENLLGDIVEKLTPDDAAAAAIWLAHDTCSASGAVVYCAGGRIAINMLAQTKGYVSPRLTPESLAQNWEAATDTSNLLFPRTVADEMAILRDTHDQQ